jgi:hypothetical protein
MERDFPVFMLMMPFLILTSETHLMAKTFPCLGYLELQYFHCSNLVVAFQGYPGQCVMQLVFYSVN